MVSRDGCSSARHSTKPVCDLARIQTLHADAHLVRAHVDAELDEADAAGDERLVLRQ
jgi:hypothetical protein